MLINENWLREWVNPKIGSHELADKLTMAGLAVESISISQAQFTKVVVAQVLSLDAHPKSDRLKVCKVGYGTSKALDIVCGASNVRAGMKVPLALIGARLSSGMKITKSRIRDVVSSGMLCSASELGLAEKSQGLFELDAKAKPGKSLAEHLQLDDTILEIELTPNRGDCLSVAGIAREVSAITGTKLRLPLIRSVPATIKKRLPIKVEAQKGCPCYVGRVVQGIDLSIQSPDWMKEKLRRCGLRPINPVVDITNYVMLELGQPMHAFDLNNINGGIIVRQSNPGETITLLDDKRIKLQGDELLICDHQSPIALAGIMGGLGSGINADTDTILFESAYFSPTAIIGKGRRIGLQTDASYRYERGVDPLLQTQAVHRATQLLLSVCGGQAGPVIEVVSKKNMPIKQPVNLSFEQVNKILGVEIKPKEIMTHLTRLGCRVSQLRRSVSVTPPSYRFDLNAEHDLIEEVARLYGYENIPEKPPKASVHKSSMVMEQLPISCFRQLLVDRGCNEVITYSFVDPLLQDKFNVGKKAINLKNPIASNLSQMRLSLAPGLVESLANNYHRQQRYIRLFEIGNIYNYLNKQTVEELFLGGIATGFSSQEQWGISSREVDFYDVKSEVEALIEMTGSNAGLSFKPSKLQGYHPGRCAKIYLGKKLIGMIGQILPDLMNQLDVEQAVYFFQLDMRILRQPIPLQLDPISRFPSTRRDLSIVVDQSVFVQDIIGEVKSVAGKNLQEVKLFDIYTGEPIDSNKKSLSLGLTFQALDRTLIEAELDELVQRVLKQLNDKFNAQIRV